jgi:hypothetical protein
MIVVNIYSYNIDSSVTISVAFLAYVLYDSATLRLTFGGSTMSKCKVIGVILLSRMIKIIFRDVLWYVVVRAALLVLVLVLQYVMQRFCKYWYWYWITLTKFCYYWYWYCITVLKSGTATALVGSTFGVDKNSIKAVYCIILFLWKVSYQIYR